VRVIAVFNHKGGVGKTTTVANLAAAMARGGARVLLIDADPQACLSVHLGYDLADTGTSLYEVLTNDRPIVDAVRETGEDNLRLVPSHLDLAGAEMELTSTIGRERILRQALDVYLAEHETDYVFIDCPPSLGLLTVNSLCASREVFVPIQTEYFALRGIGRLVDVVRLIQRRMNPDLRITGILPTLHRAGTLLAREVKDEIEKHFAGTMFKTVIRANVRLAEAPSHGKSIFAYAPSSPGAADYLALAEEVRAMPGVQVPGKAKDAKPVDEIGTSSDETNRAAPEVA